MKKTIAIWVLGTVVIMLLVQTGIQIVAQEPVVSTPGFWYFKKSGRMTQADNDTIRMANQHYLERLQQLNRIPVGDPTIVNVAEEPIEWDAPMKAAIAAEIAKIEARIGSLPPEQ